MSLPNRNNDSASTASDKSLDESSINGEMLRSSSSSHSLNCLNESSSSINGAIRIFNSPLSKIKNKITKSKNSPLMRRGGLLGQRRSSERELKMDNAEYLSGLMTLHAGKQPMTEIDKSFASDMDESARWLKQI